MAENHGKIDPTWLTDPDGNHDTAAAVASQYDQWASGYNADLAAWDYRAPDRAASLLKRFSPQARQILDAGCGTGMAGLALRHNGFDGELDGIDLSESSLQVASGLGIYRSLNPADLQAPLDIGDDRYDSLICVGVMTYVPQVAQCWKEFCRVVTPGGVVVVTQREDHWRERNCRDVVEELQAAGSWHLLTATDAEPYLPAAPGEIADLGVHYLVARVLS